MTNIRRIIKSFAGVQGAPITDGFYFRPLPAGGKK